MARYAAYSCFVALLSGAAFGQSTETTPKFEVADIHSSPRIAQPFLSGPFASANRYELRFATMLDLIRVAYGVDAERVSGGPTWLEMDRFDVFAKPPAKSTAESRKLMLRALLEDRFKLVVHNDSKPTPAYALTVGKHPQLKETTESGEPGCDFVPPAPQPPPPPSDGAAAAPRVIVLPMLTFNCHNITMEAFAGRIAAMPGAGQYLNNRAVVDHTELKGSWDFSLKFTPKVPAGIAVTGESIPLFDAIEKQLGLKLDTGTAPMPVIVVESVNQKPTENPPDVAKAFPPLPTEFDVAEIKPSPPPSDTAGRGGNRAPEIKNGRLYVPGITLKNLIVVAWNLPGNGDDMLVGAPKWLDSDRFDVIAKAPDGVAIGDLSAQTQNASSINIDALRPMLQTLLKDRFKMTVHTEDRPVPAYVLTAAKPKLKKADPTSRTKWQEGTAPDSKDTKNANSSLGRLVTCQNVTMAQFAQLLPGIAPGYLRTEVVDSTGLEGGWDFTFSFSPAGALQFSGGPKGGDGGSDGASDPSGAISLFDAMSKQLGLKLEMQKRPYPVLVIDHVEQKPTDN